MVRLCNIVQWSGELGEIENYGTFVPKNFRPQGRKFHRVELSFPGTFVPGELSFSGTNVSWNFHSWGQKFLENMLSSVYLLTYKKVTFNNGVPFMQTNIFVSFTVISELQ